MRQLVPVYISGIFLSLHYAAILYVNSTYLSQYFSSEAVSTLFLIGALGNIVLFFSASTFLSWLSPRRLFLVFLLIQAVSTVILGLSNNPMTVALSFIVYSSFLFMIYWSLDLFLEDVSQDTKTGAIRGAYLTSLNASIAVAPLLLAFFAIEGELGGLYLIAAMLLVPPILLSLFSFRLKSETSRGLVSRLPFRTWWNLENIRRATVARFLLEFFYTFMVIYTPVYLHEHIGFEWPELGVMFSIMLLPFVLFEFPAGEMADRWYGEREIMSIGFIIMGVTLIAMPLLGGSFFLWTVVLFLSRVGASLTEVTTESSFFKRVGSGDAGLISIFRLSRPFSIIAAALVGALSLSLFSYGSIFWVLASFIILGLTQSWRIKDNL